MDKQEGALRIHVRSHWSQATLALQHHLGRGPDVQPSLGLPPANCSVLTASSPRDQISFGGSDRRRCEPLQLSNGPRALDAGIGLGKSFHIEFGRVEITRFHGQKCKSQLAEIRSTDGTIPAMITRPALILGSTSRYRREMLERLRIPFDIQAPHVDETPGDQEAPADLALRLAIAKARAVAALHPEAIVIGSDQVADLEGEPIGKPGTHAKATEQLRAMRGKAVVFQTAVAVVNRATGYEGSALVPVTVRFRTLSDAEIEHYLRAEQPYDCAGSAKSEALGIALLSAIESDDPTALVGLPLIKTCELLRAAGIDPLQP